MTHHRDVSHDWRSVCERRKNTDTHTHTHLRSDAPQGIFLGFRKVSFQVTNRRNHPSGDFFSSTQYRRSEKKYAVTRIRLINRLIDDGGVAWRGAASTGKLRSRSVSKRRWKHIFFSNSSRRFRDLEFSAIVSAASSSRDAAKKYSPKFFFL